MTQAIFFAVVTALGLGIAATALFLPVRHYALARRAYFAVWLAILARCAAAVLSVLASGAEPGQLASVEALAAFARAARAVRDVLLVNAAVQLIDFVGWDLVLGRFGGGRAVSRLVVNLVNVAIILLATLGILNAHFPARLNGILVTSTVISAIIGLALQDMLANVAAGIALQLEGTVATGDWVRIGELEGEVVQLNWRTLTIQTRDRDLVIIPNGNVSRGELVNFARPTPVHVDAVDLAVGYPHVPSRVQALLKASTQATPGVEADPPPYVQLLAFGDSALEYRIRFGVRDLRGLPAIRSDVRSRALYAMLRAGLDIPISSIDVRLERLTAAAAQQAIADAVVARSGVLRPVEILSALTDDEVHALAARATEARFAAGEEILRQGDAGDTLLVIRSGTVRVSVLQVGVVVDVAERRAGDAFGEMSLFADTPRSATVTALDDVEVLILDRDAFRELLLGNPAVAEDLARIIAQRAAETEARTGEVVIDPPEVRPYQWLLKRLHALFGLA